MLKSIITTCLLGLLILSSSCNKDPFSQEPQDLTPGTLVCKVDGAEFTSSVGTAVIIEDASLPISSLSLQAFETIVPVDDDYVQILVPIPDGSALDVNTYTTSEGVFCNPVPEICVGMIFRFGDTVITHDSANAAGTAELEIIEIDYQKGGNVVGKFEGTLADDDDNYIIITEGKFNLAIL